MNSLKIGRTNHYTEAVERTIFEIFVRRGAEFLDLTPLNEWDRLCSRAASGLPTRLLDWTTNPLVTAYFAVTSLDLAGRRDADAQVISWAVRARRRYRYRGASKNHLRRFRKAWC